MRGRISSLPAGDSMPTPSTPSVTALPWRRELGATLALAWPLALGGLIELAAMTLIFIMAGHLGTVPLAGAG